MATDTGPDAPLPDEALVATASLLFSGGHETTVNLLANGLLTLLRIPAVFDRLRDEPGLIPTAVEEMLRYEPSVQFLPNRTAVDEIPLAGRTIPRGALVTLAIAAGNSDPARFPHADRFDPAWRDNQHLASAAGSTAASGRRWRGSRRTSPSPSSCGGWSGRAWSWTRRPTVPARSCAAQSTC